MPKLNLKKSNAGETPKMKSPITENFNADLSKYLLETYQLIRGQALNKSQVETVKKNIGFSGFFTGKGFGNWLAAWGIAASAIAPLLAGGFPLWIIVTALVLGLIFWRETNFSPTRAKFALGNGIRDIKIHKFNQRAYDLLQSMENKTDDEKISALQQFCELQCAYVTAKERSKTGRIIPTTNYLADSIEKNISVLSRVTFSVKETLIPRNFRELESYAWNDKSWKEYVEENFKNLYQYDVIRDLVAKQDASIFNNRKYKGLIYWTKTISRFLALSAAVIGNALGCFVAGLNTAGFFFGSLLTHYAVLPMWVPLTIATLMAVAGYYAYESNTGPALQQVSKSFLYEFLSFFRGNSEKTPMTWRKAARIGLMVIGVICSVTMGLAIGTFNLQFGNFLVAAFTNPAILTNSAALATLAAPSTSIGLIVGYISGGLVAIATTALFLKYIVSGLVALVPEDKATPVETTQHEDNLELQDTVEAKDEAQPLLEEDKPVVAKEVKVVNENSNFNLTKAAHILFTLLTMATVTFFSVYSVAYFVGLSVPLAYKALAMTTIYATGSVVYLAQSFNVVQGFLVDYGNLLGNTQAHTVKAQEIGILAVEAKPYQSKLTTSDALELTPDRLGLEN